MTPTEIVEIRRTIGQLRQCVAALRGRYGDVAAVRRLANDVERADIDAADLADLDSTPQHREALRIEREIFVVSDTPYDPKLWHDADDEGLGGYQRHVS